MRQTCLRERTAKRDSKKVTLKSETATSEETPRYSDVKSSHAAGIQFCIKCRRHAFDFMKQVYNMDNDTLQRQEVTQEANDNYRDSIL